MATSPMEKARKQVFESMSEETQKIAKRIEERLTKAAQGGILINYDNGVDIRTVIQNEGEHGNKAVEYLVQYLGYNSDTEMYALRGFADSFERDYVKEMSSRQMTNGNQLRLMHWVHLSRVKDEKKREKMLEQVFRDSISANDLEKMISAGMAGAKKNPRQSGRKPRNPSSPVVGLQTTYQILNKLNRWDDVAKKSVFDTIDEIAPDKVNDNLVEKLEQTLKAVKETIEKTKEMQSRLQNNLKRAKTVLTENAKAEKAAAKDEEYDEADAAPAKKKKKKKKAAAASTT